MGRIEQRLQALGSVLPQPMDLGIWPVAVPMKIENEVTIG